MNTSTFTILRISRASFEDIKKRIKDVDDSLQAIGVPKSAHGYADEYILNEDTDSELIRFTNSEVALKPDDVD